MEEVSVIIPTYNRIDSLRRTFSYLEKSKLKPLEVLIIDQSNADFSTQIQTLCGVEEDLAGGLDKTDIYHNSKLGYLFGKSKWSKRDSGHMASGIYGRFPLKCEGNTRTEWVMGFFFAVRRSFIIENDCQFDENLQYYAYAEDLDFSYGVYLKAVANGKKCIMSNRLVVTHNVSTEYRTPTKKATYMNYLHRYYICKKYHLNVVKFWRSNLGDLVYRFLKKEPLSDYVSALLFLIMHKKTVAKGLFLYEKFI